MDYNQRDSIKKTFSYYYNLKFNFNEAKVMNKADCCAL